MALFYSDSSVLVKRHVAERGSPWIEQLLVPAQLHQVATSRLATVEVISAFNRRVRDGSLPAASYPQLHDDFLGLCRRTYRLVLISNDVLLEARRLLEGGICISPQKGKIATTEAVSELQPRLMWLIASGNTRGATATADVRGVVRRICDHQAARCVNRVVTRAHMT